MERSNPRLGNNAVKDSAEITRKDISHYQQKYIIEGNRSASSQNIFISALKLFYKVVLNQTLEMQDFERPMRVHVLPQVFNKEQVARILLAPINIKHRTMLFTIYSCGLRCGDLLNLKIADIDSKRMLIHIKNGKGRKDRIVPLPKKLLGILRTYYKSCKPKVYLFEGAKAGEQYSEASLRQVFKKAVKKVGIRGTAKLHWLRHSYATHLLESGTDIRYIQELLGHSSSRTTEIYTHVSMRNIQQIQSPLDDMEL
jgi:integrase/recombinase XerD